VENSKDLQGAPSFPRSTREDGDFDFSAQEQSKPKSPPVLTAKRRGEVAEAAFLHKTAALGFSVSKPWGESDRYDFILDSGDHCWRVQVKSAHTSALHGYAFHACGNPFDSFPLRGQSLRAGSVRLLPASRSVAQGRLSRR